MNLKYSNRYLNSIGNYYLWVEEIVAGGRIPGHTPLVCNLACTVPILKKGTY